MKATGIVEYPFADAGARLMAARICFEMRRLGLLGPQVAWDGTEFFCSQKLGWGLSA